jgi:hypothetical protein
MKNRQEKKPGWHPDKGPPGSESERLSTLIRDDKTLNLMSVHSESISKQIDEMNLQLENF